MPSTNPALVPPNPATVDTTYGCGEGVTVPVREGLFEGEADLVGLKVARAVTDLDGELITDGVCDASTDADSDADADANADANADADADAEPDLLTDDATLPVVLADAEPLAAGLKETDVGALIDAVTLAESVVDKVADTLGDSARVDDGDGDSE